jgi:hypothetical protein
MERVMLNELLGTVELPKTDGCEIRPGVFLIGEPTQRPDLGPNKMACLADVGGALCVVELSMRLVPNA